MGWYALMLAGSNYLAPVLCGFISDGLGYRWPFYLMGVFCAASFVFLFLFLEETNYARGNVETADAVPDKIATGFTDATTDTETEYPPQKTFVQKMALFTTPATNERQPFLMHWRAWQSLRFLSWPTVFYAGFAYGTYLIWFNILNATASIILGGAPYHFRPSIVGLSYLACLVGVVLGAAYTGVFSDWFVLRMARRNGGVYEPEHRLWLFALTAVLAPASLILWGVGVRFLSVATHTSHLLSLLPSQHNPG